MAMSQSTNQNYVKSVTYKQETATVLPASPTAAQAAVNVTYFDGLGRPMQQVAHRQSAIGTGTDIVTPIVYDAFGRQTHDYLPYAAQTATMAYDTAAVANVSAFYNTTAYENTTNPYSQKRLEASPLGRIMEQGAPGLDWLVDHENDDDNTIKFEYGTNVAGEVKLFKANATLHPSFSSPLYNIALVNGAGTTYYNPGQLYKTITRDENWKPVPANHIKLSTTEEFKNKKGKVVLKRTYNLVGSTVTPHDTYYIYDQFDNLTYVIPPLATGNINGLLNDLCYQYRYDSRNRLVEKKLPGKQWEFIVYDKLDRVVATGPAYSPFGTGTSGWMLTRYDALSRPVITGWYQATVSSTTRNTLQISYNGAITNLARGTSTVDNIATGYATATYPSGFKLLTVSYYDSYGFPNAPTAFSVSLDGVEHIHYNNTDKKPKGMPTGSWARVLTTATATLGETSYTLYDKKARPVRTHTTNHLGGYTYTDAKLDFTGKALYTLTRLKRQASSDELLTREEFTYTAQDRLLTQTHRITFQGTAGPVELIAKNEYDALGQLKNKRVGGPATTPNGHQKGDYTYNIRGWLKGINNTASLAESGLPTDLFAFKIGYNEVEGMSTPLYNGNIGETYWKTYPENVLRKYSYEYDDLNRLTDAYYQKPGLIDPYTASYNEEMGYDRNGNITSMFRTGYLDADGGPVYEIDNLEYQYSRNRLLKVIDHSNSLDGFRDGQNPNGVTEPDYGYDANGNMVQDWNKGIDAIVYNHLNLPTRINFKVDQGEKFISYIYNALGQKVSKQVIHQSSSEQINTVTDYLGGYQYVGGILQHFPTAEGYVSVTNGKDFDYVYNHMDHLGNIRVSYTMPKGSTVLSILEENHYYPFGMKHANYGDGRHDYVRNPDGTGYAVIDEVHRNKYQYKYNGKEYQDELGLNFYDYGARNYDPAIGRWMNIDPLAEVSRKWSPYVYCYNNPMIFVDPDGMFATPPTDFYNLNGKHVKHIEDGKTDKKMVLTKSEKESKVQSAIDKGQVVSAFSDSESDKMSEIYNNDAENKSFTEQGFMRGTNGESEIVTGAKAGEIGSKEWASARAELSENGSTPISDVHLHPNKFDSSGNIKQFGKAMGSGAEVMFQIRCF